MLAEQEQQRLVRHHVVEDSREEGRFGQAGGDIGRADTGQGQEAAEPLIVSGQELDRANRHGLGFVGGQGCFLHSRLTPIAGGPAYLEPKSSWLKT